MIVALAALPLSQIELERDRRAHGVDRGRDRLLGEQRAAEIGMQHGAGEIEDRAQVEPRTRVELGERYGRDGLRLVRFCAAGAH